MDDAGKGFNGDDGDCNASGGRLDQREANGRRAFDCFVKDRMIGQIDEGTGRTMIATSNLARRGELRKQLDIGDFVLSEDAVHVMGKLMSDLENSTQTTLWQEHLELKLASVDSCLSSIRLIARKDLRLK